MSALANQLVTVTLGWREPNGQVVQFGGGAGTSAPAPAPAATSSGSSSQEHPAGGSNAIDLFA
ncbi:MAG TPA: hypothetical protein VGL69_12965 [Solirubrobacteraceae bacterium]|jgi:hypothetical protein